MARTAFSLVLAAGLGVTVGVTPSLRASQAASAAVVQDYARGASACTAANQDVRVTLGQDPGLPGERILVVDYPAPSADPAARDVRCTADHKDWTVGRAITFQVKPDQATRISVSFFDRRRVAYTAWRDLKEGEWQPVRIPFNEIRPNPFFQLPGVDKAAPIDVSEVATILFAPQDQGAGRLAVGRFVVSQ